MKASFRPVTDPLLLAGIAGAAGEAAGTQLIREELKRDYTGNQFNQALANRPVPEGVRPMGIPPPGLQQPAQEMEVEPPEEPPRPASPAADERDPLLGDEAVNRLVEALPPAGRMVLEGNRAQIVALIGGALKDNEKHIKDTANWLWEWFISRKPQGSSDAAEPIVISEEAVPAHCRVQYFWNEQR